ncbi:MAG: OmpA family protein, partial [Proteobacteria bacterium]|nr:OmpA family protein [Pseudomonadota bacterium]
MGNLDQKDRQRRGRWFIVLLDICFVLAVVLGLVLLAMAFETSRFLTAVDAEAAVQATALRQQARELDDLGERTQCIDDPGRKRIDQAISRMEREGGDNRTLLGSLRGVWDRIEEWETVEKEIQNAGTRAASTFMRAWADQQDGYWNPLAGSLCKPTGAMLALAEKNYGYTPLAYLEALAEFGDFQRRLWEVEMDCTQDRVFVINEDLLRFTTNEFNKFDMSDEDRDNALARIYAIVDDQTRDRRRILVTGHCDERGEDLTNYVLSIQRAAYVREKIMEHLSQRDWAVGKDYWITLIGQGESLPVDREPKEEEDASWWSRCRR